MEHFPLKTLQAERLIVGTLFFDRSHWDQVDFCMVVVIRTSTILYYESAVQNFFWS